jgi:hypothetical protein
MLRVEHEPGRAMRGGDCSEMPLGGLRLELRALAPADRSQLRQIAAHIRRIGRKRFDPVAFAEGEPARPIRDVRPPRVFCERVPVELVGHAVEILGRGHRETGNSEGRHKRAFAVLHETDSLVHSEKNRQWVITSNRPEGNSTATASFALPRCATFLQEQRYGHECGNRIKPSDMEKCVQRQASQGDNGQISACGRLHCIGSESGIVAAACFPALQLSQNGHHDQSGQGDSDTEAACFGSQVQRQRTNRRDTDNKSKSE